MKQIFSRMRFWLLTLLPTCGCSTLCAATDINDNPPVDNTTIEWLDVNSYMGKWYEIARYENRFERGMTHVTATYTKNSDGTLKIVNEGMKRGKHCVSKGRAYLPDPYNIPGRLRVSFFLWFYSDYYILELDQIDYQYAVVGSSSTDYLWILYREPVMPEALLANLLERIKQRGYDTSKFLYVDQSSN